MTKNLVDPGVAWRIVKMPKYKVVLELESELDEAAAKLALEKAVDRSDEDESLRITVLAIAETAESRKHGD